MSKQRGLGRGLDALFPGSQSPQRGPADAQEPVQEIPVAEITPNRFQPRRVFDQEALNELANSIQQYGILQPVVVRRNLNEYELVAGERRWRASKIAGLTLIPAIIRDYTDSEMTEIALIENLQREDLNPIEEAMAFKRLIEEFGLTQEEVARKIGRSRSMIANVIRLLNLQPQVQDFVSRGTLSMGHARPLLALEDAEAQLEAAQTIIEEDLSARDAEELVKRLAVSPKQPKQKVQEKREFFLVEAEDRLKLILGTQVRIKPGKMKSKIEIEYYSGEELERIIERLSVEHTAAPMKVKGTLVV